MDSITHLSHKLIAERARQQQQQRQQQNSTSETAPPPYTCSEEDSDFDEDDCDEPSMPVKLTLNAAHSIHGSNNLIPTSPTPLADATRFSTLLLHAVNQINAATAASNSTADRRSRGRRGVKVDLTINCGLTVIGDRNVIGNVGVRPKNPVGAVSSNAAAVVGAKREAEAEAPDCEGERASKRFAPSERD